MEIVIRRPWWKFWRHPLGGLNPYGWRMLKELPPPNKTVTVFVSGYSGPGDGGGGKYMFVPNERG